MVTIGTPTTASATRLLLLGSGELGREVALEAMRFGVEVIAVDRYPNAPAMQVAHRSHVISMLDGAALRAIVEQEKPDLIVPEIEAIATRTLLELEQEGWRVIPTARAANLTMNREGIRRLAAEELGLPTSPYRFAGSFEEFEQAAKEIGLPCLVKPVMSSSGKGQSMVKRAEDLAAAWDYAQTGGRGEKGRVIVEGFIDFDYEITQLTVMHAGGLSFCEPIGHFQEDGDYRLSWQPQPMSPKALEEARRIAALVVTALCEPTQASQTNKKPIEGDWGKSFPPAGRGAEPHTNSNAEPHTNPNLEGRGIFGVELFIKGDQVWFSEVSPRPHDTGLVTCISQNLSEFALHARAILGLPVPAIRQHGPAASAVILPTGDSTAPAYSGLEQALAAPDTGLMLFGKPEIHGRRRMGVALALGASLDEAKAKAKAAAAAVQFKN